MWCEACGGFLGEAEETSCDVMDQLALLPAGSECQLCGASYEDPDKCAREFADIGFQRACKSGDASVWREVWCKQPRTWTAETSEPKNTGLLVGGIVLATGMLLYVITR